MHHEQTLLRMTKCPLEKASVGLSHSSVGPPTNSDLSAKVIILKSMFRYKRLCQISSDHFFFSILQQYCELAMHQILWLWQSERIRRGSLARRVHQRTSPTRYTLHRFWYIFWENEVGRSLSIYLFSENDNTCVLIYYHAYTKSSQNTGQCQCHS